MTCEEQLEVVRGQLVDAWDLIKEGDKLFHRWEQLTKGLMSVKNLHPDDRLGGLDRVLAEVGLLYGKESGKQTLAAPSGETRSGPDVEKERVIR